MWFEWFWGAMSYILALYVAVMLVAWKMPRRNLFTLRVILCFACIIVYKYLFDYILSLLRHEEIVILVIRTLDSFVLYVLSAVSVAACFKSNFWATLFCSTAGYCMQHMSQRTYLIIIHLAEGLDNVYVNALLLSAITAAFYVTLYFMFIKKSEYGGTMLDNKVQISVSFFAVFITIFLNTFAMFGTDDSRYKIYIMVFSALAAILIVYIEFGWLAAKKEAIEKDIIRHMLHNSQEQYKLEKDMVEVINMKVHDLKHRYGDGISADERNSVGETVRVYDSFYNTGNDALDVVLTSKGLLCEKYGIMFTCMIDGGRLDFLSEEEIYSLFGNVIDNAIEAVSKLGQPEKRVISLSSRQEADGTFVIHEENYCAAPPQFVDGYPKTTKGDEYYHGFGVKSIGYIASKHRGHCKISFTDDIFEIDLSFPSGGGNDTVRASRTEV